MTQAAAGKADKSVQEALARDPGVMAEVARLVARNPRANPLSLMPDVDPRRIPRHVAVIMDGNGRWAQQRGFPRFLGHRAGAGAVRELVETAGTLGIEVLTLYSFSLENWKRPRDEVAALMELCLMYLRGEREALARESIRFVVIGRREGLPREVVEEIDRTMEATAGGTRATLCVAINYGSRAEIVDATRRLAERVKRGEIEPSAIDEGMVADSLYTAGIPDPDLLIRTAGEMRLSNYLLWQLSYSELYVTDVLWPDFGAADLVKACRAFAQRGRKFGGVDEMFGSGTGADA